MLVVADVPESLGGFRYVRLVPESLGGFRYVRLVAELARVSAG